MFEGQEERAPLTQEFETTPATDDEIAEYAAECASASAEKCAACFVGPAIAGCASFLCRRDVAKLLSRLRQTEAQRDEFRSMWMRASKDLVAATLRLDAGNPA